MQICAILLVNRYLKTFYMIGLTQQEYRVPCKSTVTRITALQPILMLAPLWRDGCGAEIHPRSQRRSKMYLFQIGDLGLSRLMTKREHGTGSCRNHLASRAFGEEPRSQPFVSH